MKKILFVIALAVVATACNNQDAGDVTSQFGRIEIEAATRAEVESTNNDKVVLGCAPAPSDLKVEIVGNNNTQTWSSLTEFQAALNGGLTFTSAIYAITLTHGEKGAEGWSKPYFEGSTTVDVPMYGLTATANVEVVLVNSIVAIETTDNFDGYFPQSEFQINGIDWNSSTSDMLFMNAGEVKISCKATRQTGSVTNLETTVTLKPTTRHTVVFDLSTAGSTSVNISFDDEIVDTEVVETELNENA